MVQVGDTIKVASNKDFLQKHNGKTFIVSEVIRWEEGEMVNVKGAEFVLRRGDYIITNESKGKGWSEAPDNTGKAPKHKAVATKKKLSTTSRKPPVKIYYSSNDIYGAFPFKKFVEVEIQERGNYHDLNIVALKNKYQIGSETKVIWVTPTKWIANRYNLSDDEYDNAEDIPEEEMSVYGYTSKQGTIIPETDDGDDGFLFIIKGR